MQTPEGFRSLADLLRSREPPADDLESVQGREEIAPPDEVEAARDVRLFRARIAEAVDSAVIVLCEDIAAEIVGRELQLAPAEIGAIVQRALKRYHSEGIARVRVHPDDASSMPCEAVVCDPGLRRGDAVLDVATGSIDVSLGVRLDSVLRALR